MARLIKRYHLALTPQTGPEISSVSHEGSAGKGGRIEGELVERPALLQQFRIENRSTWVGKGDDYFTCQVPAICPSGSVI